MLEILKEYWIQITSSSLFGLIIIIWGLIKGFNTVISFIKNVFYVLTFRSYLNIKDSQSNIFRLIKDKLNLDSVIRATKTRTIIGKTIIDIKLRTLEEILLKFDPKNKSKEELLEHSKDLATKWVKKSQKEFISCAITKEKETFELILDKYNHFESKMLNDFMISINSINTNHTKKKIISQIFFLYSVIINSIIQNTQDTINLLNGELNGKTFMNKVIEPHDDRI